MRRASDCPWRGCPQEGLPDGLIRGQVREGQTEDIFPYFSCEIGIEILVEPMM